ncbi:MAG: Gfo/Idh/MocA family oxidoreductase, partial [Pirellulaceae bacterium]|nr:Gfo/Idh/MocA family oxidoreductase [Pirellulaceae bacterium]
MKNPLPNVSRRSFLASTSAAAAAVQWTAKSYGKVIGANERIRIGFLGAGGMAGNHFAAIRNLAEKNNLEPIAVADCWKTRADEGAAKVGAKQAFQDFRKVLEIDDIDYVTIATPEHWHCEMILEAMDAGKAVYTEKPMTHTLPEALKVVRKQKETSLPLQVGVQAMSDDSYRTAGQAIREGILGQVVQAQIEYVRRYGEQGPWRVPNLDSDQPKPTDLDWKAWLGGAPRTPWNPHHYFEWRNYSMYSGGIATDLFIHRITRIMKACDLVFP